MAQATEIIAVDNPADRTAFLRLPDRLHAGDPAYVAPLMAQRREVVDPLRNPYFRHADVRLFLARRGGRPIGRIAAQIDHLAVEAHGAIGHFGLLAAEDADAVAALMAAAEEYLGGHGMRLVRGPFNLSINHEAGLLVAGFDTPPSLMTPHDLPHLGMALSRLGYDKARDLLGFSVPVEAPAPDFVHRLRGRASSGRLTIRPLDMADYDGELDRALTVFNEAWQGNWGFVPLTADEMRAMADSLRPLLDPRLTAFAEVDGEPAAMLIALPDFNEALRGLGGKLLPFGWARLLWRLKVRGFKGARVPLMGVRPKFAATALGAAMPFAMVEAVRPKMREMGYARVEMSWILEDNLPMCRMAAAMGGRLTKRWRLYERALAEGTVT